MLVIDLDPQGNLTMSQGMNPDAIERSMFDVLVHRLPISEIIHTAEVDVAVSSIDLAGAELALSSMIGRERALEKSLLEVRDRYDFIMIDTPPSLGLLTINAFVAATGVIVPVQCEYLSLRGLVQLENTLAMVRENLNPDVKIEGILPTMFDRRTLHSREAVEILEENFGDLVFKTRIRKTVRYAEAPVKGSSVLKYDPTGRPPRPTASWRRRCSMARNRASMREGPLAELFRATEAAQRQAEQAHGDEPPSAARPRSRRRRRSSTSPTSRRRSRARPPCARAGRAGRAAGERRRARSRRPPRPRRPAPPPPREQPVYEPPVTRYRADARARAAARVRDAARQLLATSP